jgi:acyl-CoA dehydrogenase
MDFEDTPEEAAFRAVARQWLEEHAPKHALPADVALDEAEEVRRGRAWQRALFDGGMAGIGLGPSLGGRAGTMVEAMVFAEEEARYRLPRGVYVMIGLNMVVPVIARHASKEQRKQFIEPTLKGELTWCQLFSEPSAGSDLANLRTKAVRDGDRWIINGQKVWSSWAHHADWGILVARSDPSLPKHKGLTFFVLDMRTPGIEVRPIKQISGASDFNEVFLTDVVIPDSCRIGAEGDGWACCMTVLMSERMGSGGGENDITPPLIDYALAAQAEDENDAALVELAQIWAEERGGKYLGARLRTMMLRGEDPGARASMMKLAYAGRHQRALGLAMELRGYSSIVAPDGDAATRALQNDYIWSTVMRIAGGADEVLRNQIAERFLGMPGEIRADKDVPFNKL